MLKGIIEGLDAEGVVLSSAHDRLCSVWFMALSLVDHVIRAPIHEECLQSMSRRSQRQVTPPHNTSA